MNLESHAPKLDGLVTYNRDGYIATIALNRPDKRNAMNLALWEALDRAVTMAAEDDQARVILLKGEGRSFCAGLDLSPENELIPIITSQPSASQKMTFYKAVKRVQAIYSRLEHLSKPSIAVIHGHCLGAGLELALCCDIRLCSADTAFGLPEARLAIITDLGGIQRLPKVVGPAHAREIAFRAHRFGSEYAESIRLVNHVYAREEILNEHALEMAVEIASNPPLAVQGAKDVFLFNESVPGNRALDYTAARSGMIMPSEDIFEAFSAYMQKREGSFKGA